MHQVPGPTDKLKGQVKHRQGLIQANPHTYIYNIARYVLNEYMPGRYGSVRVLEVKWRPVYKIYVHLPTCNLQLNLYKPIRSIALIIKLHNKYLRILRHTNNK